MNKLVCFYDVDQQVYENVKTEHLSDSSTVVVLWLQCWGRTEAG